MWIITSAPLQFVPGRWVMEWLWVLCDKLDMCECVSVSKRVSSGHYQAVILLQKKNALFWTTYQRSGKLYEFFLQHNSEIIGIQ